MNDELLEQEIAEMISKSPVKTDPKHSISTRDWILKLKPEADYAMQIAALSHDIERGIEENNKINKKEKFEDYAKFKRLHSQRSAKIICNILRKHKYDKEFIENVNHLVLQHEFGGDEETDILKDADSISFFEENLEQYFEMYGEEITRKKIRFMYDRMTERAPKFVKELTFDNKELNNIFRDEISQ